MTWRGRRRRKASNTSVASRTVKVAWDQAQPPTSNNNKFHNLVIFFHSELLVLENRVFV